ncbi:MAG TPA: ABC transporter substrate-binding protein [Methanothermococcus okinawensis]|uniref:ABC transporter substrate-binding protein n=1 Tax=Methanothermococcus okinawensis TaxID=155863 RepID=A0A833EC88_9EURY|nr:ABC transporter substrate-binding protein [Methanothermococcus okinawensis]
MLVLTITLSGCLSEQASGKNTLPSGGEKEEYITVKDMWGRDVKIRRDVNKVVLLDFTGTYLKVMRIWGIDDKVVGVDNSQKKNIFLKVVCPRIESIPDVGSTSKGLNYEAIMAMKPDVVIIRAFSTNREREQRYQEIVDRLSEMGIPVVVLLHPTSYDKPNVKTVWQEIEILGKIFNREKEAEDLINYLNRYVELIRNRTKDIPEDKRPRVLLYATPDYMLGAQTIQSYFLEDIVHGKNVLESGRWIKTSPEEILRLNPDAIIALGHEGYISPEEIYAGKNIFLNWKLLQNVKAIKERKVGSLGITEWRATVEFPIGLLREAKTLYPERFTDIDPDKEEVKLYRELYRLDEEGVKEAVKAQRYRGETH